jgi:hypothetical protein
MFGTDLQRRHNGQDNASGIPIVIIRIRAKLGRDEKAMSLSARWGPNRSDKDIERTAIDRTVFSAISRWGTGLSQDRNIWP